MRRFFIIGYGTFGQLALARLRRRWPRARFWIIDRDPERLLSPPPAGETRVLAEAGDFLVRFGPVFHDRDWIIPTVPVHLAFDWLRGELAREKKIKPLQPPGSLGRDLPYARRFRQGLYLSQASFRCPDNCPAPLSRCLVTQKKRPLPLWQFLARQVPERGTMAVIESRQLAPGLGGYPFRDLRKLRQQVSGGAPPFFIATACRCHGVVHGLRW